MHHLDYPNRLLDAIENGIIILDQSFNIYYWNRWMELNTGIASTDAISCNLQDFFREIDYGVLARKVKTALQLNSPTFYSGIGSKKFLNIRRHKVTSNIPPYMKLKVTISPYIIDEGKVMISLQDVSEMEEIKIALQKEVETVQKLNRALEQDRNIIDRNLLLLKMDTDGQIIETSSALRHFFKRSDKDLLGKPTTILYDETLRPYFSNIVQNALDKQEQWQGEVQTCSIGGTSYWLDIIITPYIDSSGELQTFTAIFHDISDKKRIERLYITDPLTKVYNRLHFDNVFEKAVHSNRSTDSGLSILLLDIDHFKNINDSYGHQIGDYVLQEMAALISEALRENDLVARWGGEEFVVLLPNTNGPQSIKVAEKLRRKIESNSFNGLRITVSLGATVYKSNETTYEMFSRADKALYKAKHEGRNRVMLID